MSISKASIITSDKLQEGGHRMLEQNKTLFKRFVDEVFNKKNVAAFVKGGEKLDRQGGAKLYH